MIDEQDDMPTWSDACLSRRSVAGSISHVSISRLGMTNPPYILDHLDEMAKILNHDRVYSFLHVPVQVGFGLGCVYVFV